MTLLKSIKKPRQQLHARDVRGFVSFFLSSGRKKSQQIVFSVYFEGANCVYTHLKHAKHAEMLTIYFKPLVKKLKFSALVAKSDLRFKAH